MLKKYGSLSEFSRSVNLDYFKLWRWIKAGEIPNTESNAYNKIINAVYGY